MINGQQDDLEYGIEHLGYLLGLKPFFSGYGYTEIYSCWQDSELLEGEIKITLFYIKYVLFKIPSHFKGRVHERS